MKVEILDRWLFTINQSTFIGLYVLCKTVTPPNPFFDKTLPLIW